CVADAPMPRVNVPPVVVLVCRIYGRDVIGTMVLVAGTRPMRHQRMSSPPSATARKAGSVFAVTHEGCGGVAVGAGAPGAGRGDARSYGTQGKSGTHEGL